MRVPTNIQNPCLGFLILLVIFGLSGGSINGYTAKPLPQLKPEECASHQTSQNVTIGATPYLGENRVRELFDLKELAREGIVPVLLVIRNDNDFGISLGHGGIAVTDKDGAKMPVLPWHDAISFTLQNKKKSISGAGRAELPTGLSGRDADIIDDFKEKAIDTRVVKAKETARGVIFVRAGTSAQNIAGSKLYISEIYNMNTSEELIFFEFELKVPPPEKPGKTK